MNRTTEGIVRRKSSTIQGLSKFNKLVVLSAPSGTGKSTLASMLLKKHPQAFEVSISYTTRLPRGKEKNGVNYFFISDVKFQTMVKSREFLEYAFVYGRHWYGTAKVVVEKILSDGKNVLFDIDVQGAKQLKKIYKNHCITIFVLPPSMEELERRLKKRKTDSIAAIKVRLKTAQKEIQNATTFDYQLINHELEKTYKELEIILKKEKCLK